MLNYWVGKVSDHEKYKIWLKYSSPGKIDTGKIDTFSEISRNFEKNNNTLFRYTELELYITIHITIHM